MTDIEILESTYFDVCTIKRKVKSKNLDTGVTEYIETIIVADHKCALSKKDDQVIANEEIGNLVYSHKLFINPNIDLKSGDMVVVNNKFKYEASEPFIYPNSHQETILTLRERV